MHRRRCKAPSLLPCHGGKSGRYDRYKEVAYDAAFLLQQHGLID